MDGCGTNSSMLAIIRTPFFDFTRLSKQCSSDEETDVVEGYSNQDHHWTHYHHPDWGVHVRQVQILAPLSHQRTLWSVGRAGPRNKRDD